MCWLRGIGLVLGWRVFYGGGFRFCVGWALQMLLIDAFGSVFVGGG